MLTINDSPLTARAVLSLSPLIPVITINDIRQALPLAEALQHAGIHIIEMTLRHPDALPAISLIRQHCQDIVIGAGTVIHPQQYQQAIDAGAQFIFSPGLTDALLTASQSSKMPFIPGISTPSELMQGIAAHLTTFKFFPAESSGGVAALNAFLSPFPDIQFCPTGGIHSDNVQHYLALKNVCCVGGSWFVPASLIQQENYDAITQLTLKALASLTEKAII